MKYGQKLYDDEKKQGTGLTPIGDNRRTVEQPGFKRQPTYQTMSESGQQEQQVDAPEVQQPQQPTTPAPSIDYNQQLNELYQQIMNRQPFKFDLNEDALYQQLVDSYANQGRMAMMDTRGQAATMTGGYGNSYAQGVGQQAYQQYIQGITDQIPDLYQMALNNYVMEGDAMYDQLAALQWKAEFDEDQRRYDQAWEQEYGSGTDNTGSNSTGNPTDNPPGDDTGDDFTPANRTENDDAAGEDAYMNRDNGGRGLSPEGQAFLDNLPYPHAGSDTSRYKDMVLARLKNSGLSNKDKELIAYRLGL